LTNNCSIHFCIVLVNQRRKRLYRTSTKFGWRICTKRFDFLNSVEIFAISAIRAKVHSLLYLEEQILCQSFVE